MRSLVTSPFNFVYCNSTVVMKIGWPWEAMDVMVKLVGCRPGLWVVLLRVSWAWNMNNITSKMPWYYKQKSILYSILHSQNTPTFCSNTPPKMGYLRYDSRGVMLLVPIHRAGTGKKTISMEWPIVYTNRKPLKRSFLWYLSGHMASISDPNPSIFPPGPYCSCQLQFLSIPTKNIISSSVL